MKKGIHPTVHKDAVTICSCGAKFEIQATTKEMHTEICSQCHPFFTGKMKVLDTAGRIDKFNAKRAAASK